MCSVEIELPPSINGSVLDCQTMAVTQEQLLAEMEDLLRNVPPVEDILGGTENGLAWFGRLSAAIRAWDVRRGTDLIVVQMNLESTHSSDCLSGYRRALVLLNEARHSLRLETVGPLSVAVGKGQVFDYFDEVRKITEIAKQDLLFVDPYLDSDFVSRYLSHVSTGVAVRLLAREKLKTLLPAVELYSKQSGLKIQVRSAPNFHDRYLFVDQTSCYQSGASFKDGAKSAPTTLTQITDAFTAMWKTYEDIWTKANTER
jgi:hypothetical protein